MDKWVERFESHPVNETIKFLINEIDETLPQSDDATVPDIERLRLSAEYILQAINASIPALVQQRSLDDMNNGITIALTDLRNYRSNQNPAHIENANQQIEQVVQNVQSLPSVKVGKKDVSLASVISFYSKQIQKVIADALQSKQTLDLEYGSVKSGLTSLENDFKGLLTAFEKQQELITNLSNDFQKQFFDQQEDRRKEFSTKITELQDNISLVIKNASDKFSATVEQLRNFTNSEISALQDQSDDVLKGMSEKDFKASKLLEAVGIKTHTYGYAGVAKEEGDAATWLRFTAIFLMLLSVAILIGPSLLHLVVEKVGIDWRNILYRIPTSLIVFVPAFYMAREASKHRETQVQNKRIELELAALTPYLELFKHEEKNKIKEELVKNYFIGHSLSNKNNEDNKDETEWLTSALPEIIDKVLDKVLDRLGIEKNSKVS